MDRMNDSNTDSSMPSADGASDASASELSGARPSNSDKRKDKLNQKECRDAVPDGEDLSPETVPKENKSNDKKTHDKPPKKALKKSTIWTLRITFVTLILSCFFSFVSELASTKAHFSIMIVLLFFLIALSIAADAIGVAATSCDLAPLLAMASRKEPGSKQAIMLVKNAERVSNICCDVIGDICGIVSGACALAIVIKITEGMDETLNMVISILVSGVVSAMTVGGKSMFKNVAVNNSKELIIFAARLLSVFSPKERKEKAKQKQKHNKNSKSDGSTDKSVNETASAKSLDTSKSADKTSKSAEKPQKTVNSHGNK